MLNQKHKELVSDLIFRLNEEDKLICTQLIDCLTELGYIPQKQKVSGCVLDFKNNRLNEKIIKLSYREHESPRLRISIKFYAANEYSQKFSDALRNVIEDHEGRYTGCYGCGKCKGNLQGYLYTYPNGPIGTEGKKVFRCGSELLRVFGITAADIDELIRLIKEQHEYFKILKECNV